MYVIRSFKSIASTNRFLKRNPDWGVIDEVRSLKSINKTTIYVARLSDKGIPIKTKRVKGNWPW